MMLKRQRPNQPILLREDFSRGTTAHRVDREAGIIYGVKLLGRTSPNNHKIPGATEGTEYTPDAIQRALPLYEGLKLNVNHPPRSDPKADRSSYDRIGKVVNARIDGGDIRGDLKLLKSHPMAERLMEAAEHMPDAFGLSHNAYGRWELRGKKAVIVEIPEVRSVDVVADAGTVSSLYESQESTMATIKVRALFESLVPKIEAKLRPTLKAFLEAEDKGDDKTLKEDDGGASMDAPPADMSPEDQIKAGFKAAIMAIIDDSSMTAAEQQKKIGEYLKTHEKLVGAGEAAADSEAAVDEAEDEEDKADEKKPVKESRRRKPTTDPAVVELQEKLAAMERKEAAAELRDFCRAECKARKIDDTSELVESLESMTDRAKIKRHLDYLKKLADGAANQRTGPRSRPYGTGGAPLTESKVPKDSKEFCELIFS